MKASKVKNYLYEKNDNKIEKWKRWTVRKHKN